VARKRTAATGRGPEASEDARSDFGFGTRVAQQSQRRLLNRDGSFNVVRAGVPFYRSLSPYHALLTTSWPRFFAVVAAGYFVVNLVFAALYLLCGPGALEGARGGSLAVRFEDAFFFSVQTLATIGYGRMTPFGTVANMLVTVEALLGLMGFALATGLLFARFSRPTARIVFSDRAVVGPFRGGRALMIRVANERSNQLTDVSAAVSLSRLEDSSAGRVRRFHDLRLDRARVVFLPLHWVIVHPIDDASPLHGVTAETFVSLEPEILVLVSGVDDTFSQAVHARSSYRAGEVVWEARFGDMFLRTEEEGLVGVDLRKLHDVEPGDPPA
jgi:inward rectifier potassium channel